MSKPKFHIAIKNAVQNETLEIHFLDYIYNKLEWTWDSGYVETNMVEEVINQVKAYSPSKIKLIIDSQGGDASIGLAIYNYLKNYQAKIETDVIGMAGSIASVIQQAASKGKRKVARNSFVVIHKAWSFAVGNSDDLRAAADLVDKYTQQIVDIYVQNNTKGKTADDINALIANGDYWMTGQEAVDMGFADEAYYNESQTVQIAARIKDLDPNYRNIPQNLLQPETPAEETPKSFFASLKNDLMKIMDGIKASFEAFRQDAPTKFPQISNAVDLINGIENALKPTFEAIENRMTEINDSLLSADELTEFRGLSQKLQDANATIEKLQEDLSNLMGGEGKPGAGGKAETPSAIGGFKAAK